jgi:hypothetical protein
MEVFVKKKYLLGMLGGLLFPLLSVAQVPLRTIQDAEFVPDNVDSRAPPEDIADSIVIFTPNRDYALDFMSEFDYFLEGSIDEVILGDAPPEIVIPRKSMIRPIKQGESYRIYLIEHPLYEGRAYYPTTIIPSTAEVEQ